MKAYVRFKDINYIYPLFIFYREFSLQIEQSHSSLMKFIKKESKISEQLKLSRSWQALYDPIFQLSEIYEDYYGMHPVEREIEEQFFMGLFDRFELKESIELFRIEKLKLEELRI